MRSSFSLFPQLAFDIPMVIWRAAMESLRSYIFGSETTNEPDWDFYLQYPSSYFDDEVIEAGREKQDEHTRSMEDVDIALDEALNKYECFSSYNRGRTQLENYGFTSTLAKSDFRKVLSGSNETTGIL